MLAFRFPPIHRERGNEAQAICQESRPVQPQANCTEPALYGLSVGTARTLQKLCVPPIRCQRRLAGRRLPVARSRSTKIFDFIIRRTFPPRVEAINGLVSAPNEVDLG